MAKRALATINDAASQSEELRISLCEMLDLFMQDEQNSETGALSDEVRATVRDAIADKLNSYHRFLGFVKSQTEALDVEIKRLRARKSGLETAAKRLRTMIAYNMDAHSVKKLDTGYVKFILYPGETTLHVFDEDAVDPDFKRTETIIKIDNAKLKSALETWKEGDMQIHGAQLFTGDPYIVTK